MENDNSSDFKVNLPQSIIADEVEALCDDQEDVVDKSDFIEDTPAHEKSLSVKPPKSELSEEDKLLALIGIENEKIKKIKQRAEDRVITLRKLQRKLEQQRNKKSKEAKGLWIAEVGNALYALYKEMPSGELVTKIKEGLVIK